MARLSDLVNNEGSSTDQENELVERLSLIIEMIEEGDLHEAEIGALDGIINYISSYECECLEEDDSDDEDLTENEDDTLEESKKKKYKKESKAKRKKKALRRKKLEKSAKNQKKKAKLEKCEKKIAAMDLAPEKKALLGCSGGQPKKKSMKRMKAGKRGAIKAQDL